MSIQFKKLLIPFCLIPAFFLPANCLAKITGEAWVQRYSNPAGSSDVARKIALDPDGNVVVMGYTLGFVSDMDVLVVKYSTTGEVLWANHYNGPANSTDEPHGMAVDGAGNVFIAGSTYNNTNNDILALAYSSSGVPLWTNRYDGAAHSNDVATAIGVDGNGDVYVTGYSQKATSLYDYDYVTLKYSKAGVPLWTNYYDGPAQGIDQAAALKTDGSGNVIVTGSSVGLEGSSDFVTVAYSASGVPLWTNRFNGTGNSGDYAEAMTLDGSGNIFIVGQSAIVAYSGAGAPLWTNYFGDGADSVIADSGGNIFVALSNFRTIAYTSAGIPLWTNRYVAAGSSGGLATAVAVDNAGKVFVTGYSSGGSSQDDYGTVAYSTAGVPLWTNRYDGPRSWTDEAKDVVVDGSGNVFVTGFADTGFDYDFATFKYSNTGMPLWTNLYNWPGNRDDFATAVCVDPGRNVYVAGPSQGVDGTTTSLDYLVLAYSPDGVLLWSNRLNGPGNINDYPNAIGVNSNGTVFVTGYAGISGIGNTSDYMTIAYSSAGAALWTNFYSGPGNGADQATALAVGPDGNVYVTGNSVGINGNADYLTLAYSSAGVPLWTNRYGNTASSDDQAKGIAVDNNGNVFVSGTSSGVGTSSDYATVAYSAAGVPLWTNRYGGNSIDEASAIVVDGGGNILVTGDSSGAASYDYATIKYSNAGVPLWTNRYNGPSSGSDAAKAIAVDTNGNVFVTGFSTGSGILFDYATVAYSSAGTTLWVQRFHVAGSNKDAVAAAVAVNSTGDVIVTGYAPTSSNLDIVTLSYANNGTLLKTNIYNGPANGDDKPLGRMSLAVAPDDSVYVVGGSDGDYGSSTILDFVTIKYSSTSRLAISRTDPLIEISWHPSFTGLQLQKRTNSLNVGDWITVPNSTTTNRMLFSPTNSSFFRLLNP
jgi:uncharacterized delta-60 repeat protein